MPEEIRQRQAEDVQRVALDVRALVRQIAELAGAGGHADPERVLRAPCSEVMT